MNIKLPPPLESYFVPENTHDDMSAIERWFASDATVRDEGRSIKGIAAIKAWRVETAEKYQHSVEPLAVSTRDGKVVVRGRVSGNFPGSPITLDHIFEIEGGKIVFLEIQ
jgi:SnoaL-like domain